MSGAGCSPLGTGEGGGRPFSLWIRAGAENFASSFSPAPPLPRAPPLLLLKQPQRMEVLSGLGDPGVALGQHCPLDKSRKPQM